MSPRPTRVETTSEEVVVVTEVQEPDIRASVGEAMAVASTVENQADVQIEVVEII